MAQRSVAANPRPHCLLPAPLAGRHRLDLDAFPSQRFALAALDRTVLALLFLPATFGLLPWHWRWFHALPVEGVVGRLMAGLLVAYLNLQGAWVVASVFAAAGLYFASASVFRSSLKTSRPAGSHGVSFYERWHKLAHGPP